MGFSTCFSDLEIFENAETQKHLRISWQRNILSHIISPTRGCSGRNVGLVSGSPSTPTSRFLGSRGEIDPRGGRRVAESESTRSRTRTLRFVALIPANHLESVLLCSCPRWSWIASARSICKISLFYSGAL